MKHYVCDGGCGGVSDVPGICQAPLCPKHGQPLRECECDSPEHLEKLPGLIPPPEKSQPPEQKQP